MTNILAKRYERIAVGSDLTNGTSLKGYIHARYRDLVAILGEPEECDGYKVSGEWAFRNRHGECVTLYDWKETDLYDDRYPSVAEFRASDEFHEFHIGGHTGIAASDFIESLAYELEQRESLRLSR